MNVPGLGDVTGYVEAWRAWRGAGDGGELKSVSMAEVWKPKEVKQACCMDDLCGRHDTFGTCGLWATKYRPEFGDYVARVALWGEVIEHEKGYRAEYCYPIAFFWMPGSVDPTKKAAAWGVEVEKPDYDELWQIAENANKLKTAINVSKLAMQRQHMSAQQAMSNMYRSGLGDMQRQQNAGINHVLGGLGVLFR